MKETGERGTAFKRYSFIFWHSDPQQASRNVSRTHKSQHSQQGNRTVCL